MYWSSMNLSVSRPRSVFFSSFRVSMEVATAWRYSGFQLRSRVCRPRGPWNR
ncbi:hypothetical protein D3C75_1327060 [compost metagenome]